MQLTNIIFFNIIYKLHADVAELADALDSGSSERKFMWVQVPSSAPSLNSLNLFTVGKMFGLFCFMEEYENFDV